MECKALLNDSNDSQIRDIRLKNNGALLEIYNLYDSSAVCDRNIEGTSYTGVYVNGAEELVLGPALDSKENLHEFSSSARIWIAEINNAWIVGIDDGVLSLQINAAQGLNIRLNSNTGKLMIKT